MSALGQRSMDNSDLTRLQRGMIKFEEIGAANGIEQHRPMFNRPPLRIHAFTIPADRKANHARPKGLKERRGIGRVVTEIWDNDGVGIIAATDRGEPAGTRTPV